MGIFSEVRKMKIKYFLLSLLSVCIVAFAFSCANGSGGTPSNNSGNATEIDIKGVWATNEFQGKDGGKARVILAFDETHAYHADEKDGALDKKGYKMPYTFVNGKLSIPAVATKMTFTVEKDTIVVNHTSVWTYNMYKVEKPTFEDLKAVCTTVIP